MKEYKRFLAFGYGAYYPSGGLEDCEESFDTIELAHNSIKHYEYFYVFDCETRKVVIGNLLNMSKQLSE